MITMVVFDLDDTLYDEVDYCRSGFAAVADFLAALPDSSSAGQIFTALWNQFSAGNRTKTFNAALEELDISYDGEMITELIKVYRSHDPKITPPADTEDILNQLNKKYTLALLTDGFLPAQQLKVRALGIEHYFKRIIYTELLGREFWKPSHRPFEILMQDLNEKPQTCAYVADNEKKDFIAPNELGFLTVQLIRPARLHSEPSDQPNAPARYVIHKISELPKILKNS